MTWKVNGRYKIFITVLSSLGSALALSILTLPVSPLVGFLTWSSLLFFVLLILEAFALEVRIEGTALEITFFGLKFHSLPVNDIISVECGPFSTKIVTLWKKVVLPPLDSCNSLADLQDPIRRKLFSLGLRKSSNGNVAHSVREPRGT